MATTRRILKREKEKKQRVTYTTTLTTYTVSEERGNCAYCSVLTRATEMQSRQFLCSDTCTKKWFKRIGVNKENR